MFYPSYEKLTTDLILDGEQKYLCARLKNLLNSNYPGQYKYLSSITPCGDILVHKDTEFVVLKTLLDGDAETEVAKWFPMYKNLDELIDSTKIGWEAFSDLLTPSQ